jgi:hypothetical protein
MRACCSAVRIAVLLFSCVPHAHAERGCSGDLMPRRIAPWFAFPFPPVCAAVAARPAVHRRCPLLVARVENPLLVSGGAGQLRPPGWAGTPFPWRLPPERTTTSRAAPQITLPLTVGALARGTNMLLPSVVNLFRILQRGEAAFGNEHRNGRAFRNVVHGRKLQPCALTSSAWFSSTTTKSSAPV